MRSLRYLLLRCLLILLCLGSRGCRLAARSRTSWTYGLLPRRRKPGIGTSSATAGHRSCPFSPVLPTSA